MFVQLSYKHYSLSVLQKCYLISLGGRNVGDTVRRMLRKIGTNFLWGGYSLKGKKGKIAFIDLPVARVIISKPIS